MLIKFFTKNFTLRKNIVMIIRYLLLFFITCIAHSSSLDRKPVQQKQIEQDNQSNITTTDKKSFYSRSLNSLYQTYSTFKQSTVNLAMLTALPIIFFSIQCITPLISTTAHESGHAVLLKAQGIDIESINIGDNTIEEFRFFHFILHKKLFSFWKFKFFDHFTTHYRDFGIVGGFLTPLMIPGSVIPNGQPSNKLLKGATALAGPFAGMAVLYGLQSLVIGYTKYRNNKNFKEAFLSGIKNGFNPYASIVNNNNMSTLKKLSLLYFFLISNTEIVGNLMQLSPFPGSDGYRFVTEVLGMKIKEELMGKIMASSQILAIAALNLLFIKFIYHTCQVILQSKLIPDKYTLQLTQFMRRLHLISHQDATATSKQPITPTTLTKEAILEQIPLIS